MLRSLIFSLTCHARRRRSRPLDYWPEPMPRIRWYS